MSALDRARAWFIAPLEPATGPDEPTWFSPPPTSQAPRKGATRWMPPAPDDGVDERASSEPLGAPPEPLEAPAGADPARGSAAPPESLEAPAGADTARRRSARPASSAEDDAGHVAPPTADAAPGLVAPAAADAARVPSAPFDAPTPDEHLGPGRAAAVTSAAVLGKPGEVEPVAAALALALRRATRAKAATVAVIGATQAEPCEGTSATGAARRLGARLEAHGLEPRLRGRLAWVRLDPGDPRLVAVVRRLALIAAPAVFALTVPRDAVTDEALAQQDLLVLVTDDPEGPLARLAQDGMGGISRTTVHPLPRTPARALARAGLRPAAAIRRLLDEEDRR